jgi:hypothetical protein
MDIHTEMAAKLIILLQVTKNMILWQMKLRYLEFKIEEINRLMKIISKLLS